MRIPRHGVVLAQVVSRNCRLHRVGSSIGRLPREQPIGGAVLRRYPASFGLNSVFSDHY